MTFRNPFDQTDDERRHTEAVGLLKTIIANQKANTEKIMSALSDLQAALADLGTALTANNAEIDLLLTKITSPGTSDADIEAAVTSIRGRPLSGAVKTAALADLDLDLASLASAGGAFFMDGSM